jgi:hypothetical protein
MARVWRRGRLFAVLTGRAMGRSTSRAPDAVRVLARSAYFTLLEAQVPTAAAQFASSAAPSAALSASQSRPKSPPPQKQVAVDDAAFADDPRGEGEVLDEDFVVVNGVSSSAQPAGIEDEDTLP